MKVVIVGIGDIGNQIATTLEHRHDMRLVLVDSDDEKCKRLAERIDALVISGDGSDPGILQEAGIADADALMVCTGSDALNTVIAMLAKQSGSRRVMVKLREPHLRPACQEIGVSRIIMPQVSAAAEFVSALFGFARMDMSLIVRGGLQLAEVPAGNAAGKKVAEVDLPDGARISALLRGDEAVVPKDSTTIDDADMLAMLVADEDVLKRTYEALGL